MLRLTMMMMMMMLRRDDDCSSGCGGVDCACIKKINDNIKRGYLRNDDDRGMDGVSVDVNNYNTDVHYYYTQHSYNSKEYISCINYKSKNGGGGGGGGSVGSINYKTISFFVILIIHLYICFVDAYGEYQQQRNIYNNTSNFGNGFANDHLFVSTINKWRSNRNKLEDAYNNDDDYDNDNYHGTVVAGGDREQINRTYLNSNDYIGDDNMKDKIQLGVCQIYVGQTCENFLKNQSVFIPPDITMEILEERLKAAYGVIKDSKDMNPNCRVYALPSLCYSILPICRTPEKTNHQYFANKAAHENPFKRLKNSKKNHLQLTTISKYPPTRDSENVRRICRNECELLENELCQMEYGIAKRHPTIGQKLPLEDCFNLPIIDENSNNNSNNNNNNNNMMNNNNNDEAPNDCSKLGIVIDVDETENCYWENGAGYRGAIAISANGNKCLKWARLMKEISDYPELAGQNFCRNPGGVQPSPWCFVDNKKSMDKIIELCAIPKCSDKMWLFIIMGFVIIATIISVCILVICCKRYKKNHNGISNLQNINLPNVDKNIYGNSRLNSPIEMTSLLTNQSGGGGVGGGGVGVIMSTGGLHSSNNSGSVYNNNNNNNTVGGGGNIPGLQSNSGTRSGNSILRVPQYTLQDVHFVEELGEGAFGKVYKGELIQHGNGEKIYVAVKALKENASVKTQADFKREIELISDLRHDNIVCILGVVLKEEPLCMLFEYMTQGDLHEFLIGNSPNETKQLTQLQFLYISMQICDGMEYLSGHHYVHRDLAARNCLVGDNLTVKISDFGLSRDIYSSDYYRVQSKSLLPVRWMPSESILYGKFTTESDVWSFGVVLWEIYSYGLQPYYGYSNQEVISMVRARQLLPCPEVCPTAVYSLMVECWHEQAVRRPLFPEIGHRLKIWYQAQKRTDQFENSNPSYYSNSSRKGSIFSVNNNNNNNNNSNNNNNNNNSNNNNNNNKITSSLPIIPQPHQKL